MRLYFDTSVLVLMAVAHHPDHAPAFVALSQVTKGRHQGVVLAHGLAETFSTLTKLPITPMFHPTEAYRYISQSVAERCAVVALGEKDYLAALEQVSDAGLRGGILYDLLQLKCAEKAHCDRIYAFNVSHFVRLAPQLENRIMRP